MADTNGGPAQRLQFGDINPVKAADETAYTSALKNSKISEKATYADLEDQAVQIADADLNRKKKQVPYGHTSQLSHKTCAYC